MKHLTNRSPKTHPFKRILTAHGHFTRLTYEEALALPPSTLIIPNPRYDMDRWGPPPPGSILEKVFTQIGLIDRPRED